MITSMHSIKIRLEGRYDIVSVIAAEDEDGRLLRLDLAFQYWVEVGGIVEWICEAAETLYEYANPEIKAICKGGVWNLVELAALLDEFGEEPETEGAESAQHTPSPVTA